MVENPHLHPLLLTLTPSFTLLPACHFQRAEVTQVGKQAVGFVRSAGGLLASVASLMRHIRFHGLVCNDTTALVMYLNTKRQHQTLATRALIITLSTRANNNAKSLAHCVGHSCTSQVRLACQVTPHFDKLLACSCGCSQSSTCPLLTLQLLIDLCPSQLPRNLPPTCSRYSPVVSLGIVQPRT